MVDRVSRAACAAEWPREGVSGRPLAASGVSGDLADPLARFRRRSLTDAERGFAVRLAARAESIYAGADGLTLAEAIELAALELPFDEGCRP